MRFDGKFDDAIQIMKKLWRKKRNLEPKAFDFGRGARQRTKQPWYIEFCKKWKFSEPAGLGPDAKRHQKGHREKLPPNQKEFFFQKCLKFSLWGTRNYKGYQKRAIPEKILDQNPPIIKHSVSQPTKSPVFQAADFELHFCPQIFLDLKPCEETGRPPKVYFTMVLSSQVFASSTTNESTFGFD